MDVADEVAAEIMALVATEPPLHMPDNSPRHLDRYIDLLSREGRAPKPSRGLIYELPHRPMYDHGAPLVDSESAGSGAAQGRTRSSCSMQYRSCPSPVQAARQSRAAAPDRLTPP